MEFPFSEERYWLPVHTKPRCEKKFTRYCDKYDITSYLPLKVKIRSKGRGTVRSELPMFPGYAFAWLSEEEKSLVSRTNSIVRFVRLSRDQELSLREDLHSISILEKLQENQVVIVSPEIKVGEKILVSSGPLSGLNGIVEKRKGTHRVVVNVEMINQSVSMELDTADLELDL
jgi:transcriptional antiterminator RfaH